MSSTVVVSPTDTPIITVTPEGVVEIAVGYTPATNAVPADGTVTDAKLANMPEATVKGRAAGSGTGVPVSLTATQVTAILNAFLGDSGSGGTKGLVPAPAAGDAAAGKYLKADGTFAVPSGAGGSPGGASTYLQYNNGGVFGAVPGMFVNSISGLPNVQTIFVIGTDGAPPSGVTVGIRGASRTSGTGSGAKLVIAGGNKYGLASGGDIGLGTYPSSASGAGTYTERITIQSGGAIIFRNGTSFSLEDSCNVSTGSVSGTIIATTPSQKLGFWGAAAHVQPATSGLGITSPSNVGVGIASKVDDAFDGDGLAGTAYTIADIVYALKLCGILPA